MIKFTKTSILPNCQVPNSFFGKTVNFIIQKQLWEKKTLLYYFCWLEIDHVTQQPKETCQRTCRGPKEGVEMSLNCELGFLLHNAHSKKQDVFFQCG